MASKKEWNVLPQNIKEDLSVDTLDYENIYFAPLLILECAQIKTDRKSFP